MRSSACCGLAERAVRGRGSLWFLLSRPGELGYGALAAVYFASALPFFLAGTVVSIAMSEAIERVDRAYFFDLAGAAAGCLVLIPFLNVFGGPNTVIAAGVFLRHRGRHLVSSGWHRSAARGGGAASRCCWWC